MVRYILLFSMLALFIGFLYSLVSMIFRKVGQWNVVVRAVAERYGGQVKPGGIFSDPAMYFSYNDHYCNLKYGKRRLTTSDKRVTEFTSSWPDRRFQLLMISKGYPADIWPGKRLTEFKCDDDKFNSQFMMFTSDLEVGKKLLSDGVKWQTELMTGVNPEGALKISIMGGLLSIVKPMIIRETTELDDWVRFCVEYLDQMRLTQSIGIEFEQSETAKLIEEVLCPICSEEVVENMVVCIRCKTPHCRDCWEYNGQCATFACGETRFLNTSSVAEN